MRTQLRKARQDHCFTQAALAARIGISARMMRAIESGTRTGSSWIWDTLEDILGVPQRQLRERHKANIDNSLQEEDGHSSAI